MQEKHCAENTSDINLHVIKNTHCTKSKNLSSIRLNAIAMKAEPLDVGVSSVCCNYH